MRRSRPSSAAPRRPAAVRSRAALLAVSLALLGTGCEREVALSGEDPLAVEAANAGMDALLLTGPTARRIAAHRLTAERVERWFIAQEALDAQSADDPSLGGGAGASGAGGRGDDAIERAVAALEDRPGAEEAIRGAGLSVEEFVLTGLALHQALTASAPAAPAEVRRLAARNVRFVVEHADLLARFRTQRPMYVADAPTAADSLVGFDSLGYYDPFADTLVHGAGTAAAPPPDTVRADSIVPDPLDPAAPPRPRDTTRVPPRDTLRPPPPAGVLPARVPPAGVPSGGAPPAEPPPAAA